NKTTFTFSHLSAGDDMSPESERGHALDISGAIIEGKLALHFNYSIKQYYEKTILRLAENYKENLLQIIEHCCNRQDVLHTPSDYGTANVTITQLEKIKANLRHTVGNDTRIEKILTLSPMQEGLLFHHLYNNEPAMYFEQSILDIRGEIHLEAYKKSLEALSQRHEVLRTVFLVKDVEIPLQAVLKERKPGIAFDDISRHPREDIDSFIETYARRDRERGFDLFKDPLIRVSILQTRTGSDCTVGR
ncbi:MAG: hypothetical protein GY757_61810, partial [bacterium]|nr:hypothetical protein [bacterium]